MAANRIAYALDMVQTLLDADSSFTVRKRWDVPPLVAGAISFYAYHASTTYGETFENGRTESGVMNIIVAFDVKKTPDPSGTGAADAAYADVVYRVEKAVANSTWPKQNTDGTFDLTLASIRITAIDGHVDVREDYIRFGVALEIPFTQATIA